MTTNGQGHSLTFDQDYSDSTFSNFFSSTNARPFEAKFHLEPPWDVMRKTCSDVPGTLTTMASRSIYDKKPSKISFFGTKRPVTLKLGIQHRVPKYYLICSPRLGKRKLVSVLLLHLYVYLACVTFGLLVGWLCWGLTSQSTIFQSYRDGAIASWVINQYFRGVKCLAQGHNTAAVGLEPRTSRSGVRHSTTEPPRSPYFWVVVSGDGAGYFYDMVKFVS